MRKGKRLSSCLAGAACVAGLAGTASAALYAGNAATGFGGTVGNGNVAVTDDALGNITFKFNPSGSFTGNDVVLYIDSTAGGFADTSTFSDNNDAGRTAISAANTGNPSRDLITFSPGFLADYAIEFQNNTFIGLFSLASGGNNSLNFITGNSPSGGNFSVTFPIADLGIVQGQSLRFEGDLISTTAYGSNETIGASTATPTNGGDAPNVGFNGNLVFSAANTYASTPVPEPVSLAVVCVGGLVLSRRRSRLA